jgi:hypothetical protein
VGRAVPKGALIGFQEHVECVLQSVGLRGEYLPQPFATLCGAGRCPSLWISTSRECTPQRLQVGEHGQAFAGVFVVQCRYRFCVQRISVKDAGVYRFIERRGEGALEVPRKLDRVAATRNQLV